MQPQANFRMVPFFFFKKKNKISLTSTSHTNVFAVLSNAEMTNEQKFQNTIKGQDICPVSSFGE